MDNPVVLIGTSKEDGTLVAVGLYASTEAAGYAVMHDAMPGGCHWSVMTPPLGTTYQRRSANQTEIPS